MIPWLKSPWPLLVAWGGLASLATVLLGDVFEIAELRWLGQIQRWRLEAGTMPPVDPAIIHLDIGWRELEKLPDVASEYSEIAQMIERSARLGARVVVLDMIAVRGSTEIAQPILAAVQVARENGCIVVFAEAEIEQANGEIVQRVRSFPFRDPPSPAGMINVEADSDGVFRHYEFVHASMQGFSPSLALAAYGAWRGLDWKSVRLLADGRTVEWGELSTRSDSLKPRHLTVGPALLDYRGGWSHASAFPHFSPDQASTLAEAGGGGPRPWENAIVILSYVAAGIGDIGSTPMGPREPRAILHSTALNQLVQQTSIRRTPRGVDAVLLGLIAFLGLVGSAGRRISSLIMYGVGGGLVILFGGAAVIYHTGWIPGTILLTVVWSVAVALDLARRYSVELVERTRLDTTMGYYFSPRVREHVLRDLGAMNPKGVEITTLLTDLRDSMPLTEHLGPHGTFKLLNEIFTAEIAAAMAEDGTLEHFLGDQFLAYWGAPEPMIDSADRALRAAFDLIERVDEVRDNQPEDVRKRLNYGVALHSGHCLIGNKGSRQRLDYGIVGEMINAAARVESLTKVYGVRMIATGEVLARLSVRPPTRLLDRVIVKGKSAPLELHEVAVKFSETEFRKRAEQYAHAFAQYAAGEFTAAALEFKKLGDAGDPPSVLMEERCEKFKKASPGPTWSGVYKMEHK